MGILQTVHRRHVTFNPANEKHRNAYWKLRRTGRQDDDLRFILDEGFANVLSMMQARLADHFSAPVGEEVVRIRKRV